MAATLPLEEMSVEEKLQAMESLWDDLCGRAGVISSPDWHEDVLAEREAMRVSEGASARFDVSSYHLPTAARSAVSELDRLKEQLAYLKFWQGIVVVTDISLGGWLVSASENAAPLTFVLAIVGVGLLSVGIVVLHRQIERRIDEIGEL